MTFLEKGKHTHRSHGCHQPSGGQQNNRLNRQLTFSTWGDRAGIARRTLSPPRNIFANGVRTRIFIAVRAMNRAKTNMSGAI